MKTITIKVELNKDIDLAHMLESVSEASCNADNVTVEEHDLLIQLIQKLIKNEHVKMLFEKIINS